ncbi:MULTISPECIES: cell division protein FtsQ/DivIB [unclassified Streptomyces]|uniref:cell division protein FtsQ/DivIB n=1 Tax=unclassified Streptomyces TaxID=2593676 RepID=UPI0029A60BEA|nr:FtsQ-type POTRA domain-containing protein [Streptomyces sp. FL07-04A]MDX3579486.1 FtsQ-type POTRA domain-containing protein [Streptomyces sp. FL07-04A]
MAGSATAERGARQQESSGPPLVRRLGPRRLRMIIIFALAVSLLGGGAVWALYGSQWLRVREVTVTGTAVLTPQQVRDVADVTVGTPLISVDTDAVESRLRKELPRIDSVEAVRSWPHEISVKVVERTPVLLIRKGAKFVEVDDEGVRFATVSEAPKGIPLLETAASSSRSAAASLRRFTQARLVREAVRAADSLPSAVARETRLVRVRSYDDIALRLTGGRTVAWGSAENGAAKGRALTALMKAAPAARHFDVSAPTAPASSGS